VTPQLPFLVAFGLIVGSFLNVCIGRLPAGESVAFPGSRCPYCRTPIRWYDNLPVISYLFLGGRCRQCKARISLRYPLIEATTCLAFVLQGLAVGEDVLALSARLVFTAALIVMFGTDLETQRLPDAVTIPTIVAGLIFSVWLPPGVTSSVAGAALGAGVLLFVRWAWKAGTGTDGMGLGDVKMLAAIGAFLGWQHVWLVLFLASLSGAMLGIVLAGTGRQRMKSRLPFGTFLAVGAFVSSLAGDRLITWYLSRF
jgi:leader peptidase (prepilin peptidase)/N-methyltransferase